MSPIVLTNSTREYFYDKLQPFRLGQNLEFYLVDMLTDFAGQKPQSDQCVAFMLRDVLELPVNSRIGAYKRMGDHCLAHAGVFREFAEKQTVGLRYYQSMGAVAYKANANLVGDKDFADLYRTLGDAITDISQVLHLIFR